MESEEDYSPDCIKQEQNEDDEADDVVHEMFYGRDNNYMGQQGKLLGVLTPHYGTCGVDGPIITVDSSLAQRPQIEGQREVHNASAHQSSGPSYAEALEVYNGHQRPILPKSAEGVCQPEGQSNTVGDYLQFVEWIRSFLLRMHPELAKLPDDVPLVERLKWPSRHAWSRKIDEECPEFWRRYRSKEARRLSAISNRCYNLLMKIGKKIVRGEMKNSTPSKVAGSSTFDFLAKKNENEQFKVLFMVESGELKIKDANSLCRLRREKKRHQNAECMSEDSATSSREEPLASMLSFKKPRFNRDTFASPSSGDFDSRLSTDSNTETQNQVTRLKRTIEDLKKDLIEMQAELQKAQDRVLELEEENEIVSSLVSNQRSFQKRQNDMYKRHLAMKDDVIQRIRADVDKLTGTDASCKSNSAREKRNTKEGSIERLEERTQCDLGTTNYNSPSKEIKPGDYVLYHTVNGKGYMGRVVHQTETENSQVEYCVEYAESLGRNRFDFSQKKVTYVTKDSIFRWGDPAAIGACVIGLELHTAM